MTLLLPTKFYPPPAPGCFVARPQLLEKLDEALTRCLTLVSATAGAGKTVLVKSGEKVAPIFCNCSAGFHKKPWEGALGQKIQVEVLESLLKGDNRCRFAIHLPE